MQTHTNPYLRAHRRAAAGSAAIAPWRKLLAGIVSASLCLGMMPLAPAWGNDAASLPAQTTAEAASGASDAVGGDAPEAEETTPAAPDTPADGETAAPDSAGASEPASDAPAAETEAVPIAPAAPADAGATDTDNPAGADVPSPAVPDQADEGTPGAANPGDPTAPTEAVDQYFPADKQASAKLLKKLVARFSTDGDDGKLSAKTADAAIALNALGKGADIDVDALVKNFLKDEKSDAGLTLGQYGRYIMALTAGGIDCAKAQIGSKTRNLVVEMEKLSETTDPTLEDAVYLLPVYGNDKYRNISGVTPEGLIDLLLAAQDDDGFFWASEKADTYSIPLTGQALLALMPYAEDDDEVAAAVVSASEALYDAQLIDGSWPADGLALTGDVPATAYATTALVALGADPSKDLKTSNDSTPLGYLTAHADKALDGYADLDGMEKDAEPAASAAVLMALAANKGYADSKEAFDVYDVREVKRPATTTPSATPKTATTTPSSTYKRTTAAKTIPQSGDELPWTMGFTAAAGAFALAAALIARRRIREL